MAFRCFAVPFGTFYLFAVAGIFTLATRKPIGVVLPVVVAAAVIIMACLGYFAVRMANRERSMRQFDLSALMLLVVPLSIYLAALRRLFQELPLNEGSPRPIVYVIWTSAGIVFIAFSTMILLWMAEALMWTAAAVAKWYAKIVKR